jgi:glycosyltransferase involved in cell wall biosynthesis
MKVLLVNTYEHGGAAIACLRLHRGLLNNQVQSNVLLLNKRSPEVIEGAAVFEGAPAISPGSFFPTRRFPFRADRALLKKEIRKKIPSEIEWFSFPDSGYDITSHPLYKEADIINIHWASDFLDYRFFLKNKKPVVWTMHDMNPFTGGCHYSENCERYEQKCGWCPQLSTTSAPRYSSFSWKYKNECLSGVKNLTIVPLSRWLMDCSQKSSLFSRFPHVLIPNGLNSALFSPVDRSEARQQLGLPEDKKIILFVAYGGLHGKRKGYHLLEQALGKFDREDLLLCAVGGKQKTIIPNANVMDFGFVEDDARMARLYSAADLFVLPSLQDNLPNTAVESILCGTPVVGFSTGGVKDIVIPGLNGILAGEISSDALFTALQITLNSLLSFDREKIRRDAVSRYDQQVQAEAYVSLFSGIMQKLSGSR